MQEKSRKNSVSGTAATLYREPSLIVPRPGVTDATPPGAANRSGAIDNSSKRTISTDCPSGSLPATRITEASDTWGGE
jgi:hypothetical protein